MNGRTSRLLPLALAVGVSTAPAANGQTPSKDIPALRQWPTSAWAESSPEAQGMSSDDLADALELLRANNVNIHSLTVVRNGVIVLDAYFYPFTRQMRHDVASVTKSIVSLLVGIATADGHLRGVDQPVIAALPGTAARQATRGVERIRIGDLLAMQSGFDCGFRRGEPELRAMVSASDWVAYTLGLPMIAEPGTRFGYCSPNFHLLSAAIATSTTLGTLDYARAQLFQPLGIDDVHWPADAMGFSHGWGDLQLRPRDMAKIGLLMLHGGRWEDRQIVPQAWIDSSLAVRANVNENEDYGLGWRLSRRLATLFEANGRGGQRITVVPAKNTVVVMTGGGFEPGDVGAFLLKSMRADAALADNPTGQARLADDLRSIATPPPSHPVSRSPTAAQVSRRVYRLEDNPLGIRSFMVDLADPAAAMLRLTLASGPELVQLLGLDGVYRVTTDQNGAASAGRGEWLPDGRLRVEFNRLARINRYVLDVEFLDDGIRMVAAEPTELGTVTILGTVPR